MDIDKPGAAWPEKAAIAMIAIPVALFFGTWFQPALGLSASALVLWATWRVASSVSPLPLPSRRAMAFLVVLALLWTWLAGLGGYFQQMWDHNFRNALMHDLINHPWPVVWKGPEGTVALDYYLAWSILPALAGKMFGWKAATLTMAAICAAGAFLVLLIFARVAGSWRWWIPFVFLLWSGMDIVGWGLRRQFDIDMLSIEKWSYPPLWYTSHMVNFFCTPHLALPTWLITLMVAGRRVGPRGVWALSSLLFPLAPFQTVGLVPFAAWGSLQGPGGLSERLRRILTSENIAVSLVVLAMCAPYYLGNAGAGKESGWFFENSPSSLPAGVIYIAFLVVEVLAAGVALWLSGQRDRLLLLTLVVLCLIPLRRCGVTNDLALKVPLPGLAILALYTAKAFLSRPRTWGHWLLIGVFALGVVTPLHEIWVPTRFMIQSRAHLEVDEIQSFDPALPPMESYQACLGNFRSRPLEQLPMLRWMLPERAFAR